MRGPTAFRAAITIAAIPLAVVSPPAAAVAMADKARQLRIAAGDGNMQQVMSLLDGGVEIDFADEYGLTPLMAAAFSGQADVVRLLLDRGADAMLKHSSGMTALDYAKSNGHRDVVQLLAAAMGVADPMASQRATTGMSGTRALAPRQPQSAAGRQDKPVAAPAAPPRAGLQRTDGAVALGLYTCRDAGAGGNQRPDEYGAYQGGAFTTTKFEVTGPGTYVYRGARRTPGSFAYNAGTGAVRFTSGPLAATGTATVTAQYGMRGDGKPALHLTYRFNDGTSAREFCAPMTR